MYSKLLQLNLGVDAMLDLVPVMLVSSLIETLARVKVSFLYLLPKANLETTKEKLFQHTDVEVLLILYYKSFL